MKSQAPHRSTTVSVVAWICQLAAAGILGVAAYLKVSGHQADIDLFTKIGMEPLGRFLIGGIEMLAATLLLIPQSAIYGALLGLGVMLGAVIGHLTAFQLDGIQYALGVAVLCVVVLVLRRFDAEFLRNLYNHYTYDED